ncbi:glycosyltransferase involved in cell wall biosynthesis [Labedella gwakjiensis]|uniref:D-inositol 3-phosphate glycosyltransferase n=1 Tax=Labedella gwakjiensis TaxID=390269 RepID=A0A2P8GY85_9MICO|nr:glycosyltransferase [Labedella gwakjiensis]PSL38924.1 glycosyltransferase involved in cell wall biosynthesis [Labedella gwakjiensis]RUQ86613.1 glycosyltransferase [Labedella gwakjiensis]
MAGLIVHEWIERHGGSENVVDSMATAFPDAAIHCLWNNAPDRFPGRTVTESWMSKTPLRRSKAFALPFMPSTWYRTDISEAEFVLVSSHLFAHHVGAKDAASGPPRFVYVHTPGRYIWTPELDARGDNPVTRAAAPLLKKIDRRRALEGADFAANSDYIRNRVSNSWGVDARVIHPPVRVGLLQSESDWRNRLNEEDRQVAEALPPNFILGASRFVDYKRLDVAIRAGELADLPVVLAGAGPQLAELQQKASTASVPVTFVHRPSDELLFSLYQQAALLVFAAVEDFGIMPVEAMSLGTPVLVIAEGGASESVRALSGGSVIETLDDSAIKVGISESLGLDMTVARASAGRKFGPERFERDVKIWVKDGIAL